MRLHIAQRHGQQRRALGAFSKALDDAKGRCRELHQRRHIARGRGHGEHIGVAQRATRCILELRRQLHHVLGIGLHGGREAHAVHQRVLGQLVAIGRHDGCYRRSTALEAYAFHQLAWHRRAERQAHGADRQAGGIGVFALAAEVGRERLTYLIFVALLVLAGQAIGHGHTLAIDQGHLAARGQAAVTGQHRIVLRILGGILVPVALLEHSLTVLAFDQLHGNALAHTFGGAPDPLLETVNRSGSRQAQGKVLLLIDLFIGAGSNPDNLRTSGLKLIAGSARQCCA